MSKFVDRASSKLDKLSDEQIKRLLKNQEDKLRLRDSLLNGLDSGILVLDSDKRIVFTNQYTGQIFNFNCKNVISSFCNSERVIQNTEVIDFIRDNNDYPGKEKLDFDQDSAVFGKMRVRVSASRLKEFSYTMFRFLDITLFEKMKYEFKKNESLAKMTTLAATVAHEIKNPLASISIYLQLLQKKFDRDGSVTKEQAEKSLSVINSEIARLNGIAVDFLFAVKPMNVNLKLNDLNECVKNTLNLVKAEIADYNIDLIIDLGSGLPKANMDTHLIEQCLLNLLKNSIQAVDKEKNNNFIKINTYLDGNSIKLAVTDSGCGMSQEQISKIFEPYYTTKANGSGLGLTTIYKIMKEHGGEINVSSVLGNGATFTMVLPVPPCERFKLR